MGNKYYQLSEYIQNDKIAIDDFLEIAINICDAVHALHKIDITHGSLSTSCIWLNDDKKIKLTESDVSDNIRKNCIYKAPEQITKNLKYMNHTLDIYTLGIVFYEMLLGELPYQYNSLLEFSHTIVTQNIPFVSHKDESIPHVLSLIIEKMVLINQSERYKNVLSVSIDLSKALKFLDKDKQIEDFPIDTFNNILDLHTSDILYGREKEEQSLQYIIDSRVDTSNQVMVVYGNSGVGKSSLVKKVIEKNKHDFSYMFHLKFDYGEQNTPYQTLYTALRNLTKQIIVQNEDTLKYYRNKLHDLLGVHAQVLIDVIPDVEIILGEQPETEISDTLLTKVNLDNILVGYMELFLDEEKPLCIWIDDLQWIDKVTMLWLQNTVLKLKNIVLFLTYRDEESEVSKSPRFSSMLHEFSSYGLKVEALDLLPLCEDVIDGLLVDNMQLSKSKEISHIIFQRTKGNPFFLKQYLKQLYADNAIWFDLETLSWKYDLSQIEKLQISDNVFDMLYKTMDSLGSNVKKLLCIASCMGNTFSRSLLEKVFADPEVFEHSLFLAVKSGWIFVDDNIDALEDKNYRFLHDKMQETIYQSILGKLGIKIHYDIGYYLENQGETLHKHDLILCVNHLNIGSMYVEDKAFLGRINFEASFYAKKSGDFENALTYIKKSMELLLLNSSLEESVSMLKVRAECEHLCNHSDEAIRYYEKALELATSQSQKGEIYELMIKLYSDISNFKKAYEIGRLATKMYGITIPEKFIPPLFAAEFLRLKFKLRPYTMQDLVELPESRDEDFKMAIRILANTLQAAYQIKPELCVANAMIIVRLCLDHGLTKESVIGFTVFGVIFQGAILGNHKIGFSYSTFSFEMLKRFENTIQHAEVQFVCGYFATSWEEPSVATEVIWEKAYKNGLEIGDWFHAGCAAAGVVQSMFMRGVSFEDIFRQIEYFEVMLKNIGAKEQYGAILSVKQALLNLSDKTLSPQSFESGNFDETSYVESINKYESEHFSHYYFINKMITLYIHREYEMGVSVSKNGKKFTKSSHGMLHNTEYLFYDALFLAQLCSDENVIVQMKNKRTIDQVKKKFLKWAESCSENFLVRGYILQGEACRLKNNMTKAFFYYEKAIESAKVYGQIHLQAIANRLTAELYEKLDQSKAANMYHKMSLENFKKWGMKQDDTLDTEENWNFDVSSLIKASEVIAQEHEFSNLLTTLIQIIMENAGAQNGFLLLEKEGTFFVQASSRENLNTIYVMQDLAYTECDEIVHPVVNYVLRTKEVLVIDDMRESDIFDASDVNNKQVKSVMCAPLVLQGILKGVIYLENNLLPAVFTEEKVKLLQHLSGQIIISIENTIVYNNLEEKIKQRTKDLEVTQKELKLLVSIDPLTKLYNRRYFSEISGDMFMLAKNEETDLSLIMIDIDNFKSVNDTYGHQSGDNVLMFVSSVLLEYTRKDDIVCRFGGEEFIILLPKTSIQNAVKIADKMRELIETSPITIENDRELKVTISTGISLVDHKEDWDIEVSIGRADTALYEAKTSGKNKVVLYNAKV